MNRYAEAQLVLEVGEQVEDAGPDGRVEGGHRLVQHQQARFGRQRPGDADALALAAGQLVREAVAVGRGPGRPGRGVRRPGRGPWRPSGPGRCRGSATASRMRWRGLSEPYGSWKTGCMRGRRGRSSRSVRAVNSRPSKRTSPPSGRRSWSTAGAVEDLPQPDGPFRARVSPASTRKDTWSTRGDRAVADDQVAHVEQGVIGSCGLLEQLGRRVRELRPSGGRRPMAVVGRRWARGSSATAAVRRERAAGAKAQPGGRASGAGGEPGMEGSRRRRLGATAAVAGRQRRQQARRVRRPRATPTPLPPGPVRPVARRT